VERGLGAIGYGLHARLLAYRDTRLRPMRRLMEETSLGKRVGRLAVVGLAWAEVLLVAGVLVHVAAGRRASIRVQHGRLPATVPSSSETTVDARIGFAASVVANLGVQVRCWSQRD